MYFELKEVDNKLCIYIEDKEILASSGGALGDDFVRHRYNSLCKALDLYKEVVREIEDLLPNISLKSRDEITHIVQQTIFNVIKRYSVTQGDMLDFFSVLGLFYPDIEGIQDISNLDISVDTHGDTLHVDFKRK